MNENLPWKVISDFEAEKVARNILRQLSESVILEEGLTVKGRKLDLPFYKSAVLYNVAIFLPSDPNGERPLTLFALSDGTDFGLLDGRSGVIHEMNLSQQIKVTQETAADYLRFFCFAVRGADGPFILFEKGPLRPTQDEKAAEFIKLAAPFRVKDRDEQGRFIFEVTVIYTSAVFKTDFAVAEDGNVEMVNDNEVMNDIPKQFIPKIPELFPINDITMILRRAQSLAPTGDSILRTMVELLLELALGKQKEGGLLAHFNAKLEKLSPLDQFAQFVATALPVVAIESSLPFVEESISQIVEEHWNMEGKVTWTRPEVEASDDTRLRFKEPRAGSIVLLPFHSYRAIVDVARVAHEIAALNVGCLIGCERVTDLPNDVQQVIDLTLRLPRLGPDQFEVLFKRTLHRPPPVNWRNGETHWVSLVHYSDFQHPLGLEMTAEESINYIRDRALQRLQNVEPEDGPSLRQLEGLGEARRFAEDLIADIREAVAGRLDWNYVDRGVLLVGKPGTGKTTLARAIAKECGIRFINASASGWQAAGFLGDHIRAMRADFALARRFAPSILFIDEIDSVGSRDAFVGQNAQYSTQVVNSLLEQIQGMNAEAPVIVIAATNQSGRIDPALKRAGRLDREIEIPRPNIEALTKIFDFYLGRYTGGNVTPDIDSKNLAQLAFGCTAADVDLFVRGAARRARKQKHPVSQDDLLEEVLRKPRDPESSPRLSPAEIHRVAVHESGHAMASLLSNTHGENISYISIIPRTDGSLGFVAVMPADRALLTQQDYREELEVMLGGRAAEELIFGPDGITGGARSDLEVATRSAILITTQYGLGPDRKLLWSSTPTSAQLEDANRLMEGCYKSIIEKMRPRLDDLKALVAKLESRQEITGDEAREFFAARIDSNKSLA